MKCPKCKNDNRKSAKFCGECGAALAPASFSEGTAGGGLPKGSPSEGRTESFWKPDWRWHFRALAIIYASLVAVYFLVSLFLSRVPEPYRMRDIPQEMTPWLKK